MRTGNSKALHWSALMGCVLISFRYNIIAQQPVISGEAFLFICGLILSAAVNALALCARGSDCAPEIRWSVRFFNGPWSKRLAVWAFNGDGFRC